MRDGQKGFAQWAAMIWPFLYNAATPSRLLTAKVEYRSIVSTLISLIARRRYQTIPHHRIFIIVRSSIPVNYISSERVETLGNWKGRCSFNRFRRRRVDVGIYSTFLGWNFRGKCCLRRLRLLDVVRCASCVAICIVLRIFIV